MHYKTNMNIRFYLYFFVFLFLFSCEPEITDFHPSSGEADFSVYIALGGSETAGFTNGELYKSGQIVSYPNIISRQLLHVGGGEFRQPLMMDEYGFGNRKKLGFVEDCMGDSVIAAVSVEGMPDESNLTNIYEEMGPFHNLGVPGAKIQYMTAAANSTHNPFAQYFLRFCEAQTSSILDDAIAHQPTFFSIWVGLADILHYALTGGGQPTILNLPAFDQHLALMLGHLKTHATGGVIANIPDVTVFPYFSHIPAQGVWVQDSLEASGKRLLVEEEKILLAASEAIKCQGLGSESYPIPEELFLSEVEIKHIREYTLAFNDLIKNHAVQHTLAFIDIYAIIESTQMGLTYDGITFSNHYIWGGLFSIDGYSFSGRGNAILANAFIEAINDKYQSTIPKVSISQFQGVEYP